MQVSNAIYFVVVTVCAPLWEEAIFRGFLLPSLTKYMPVHVAILVSALGFAGARMRSSGTPPGSKLPSRHRSARPAILQGHAMHGRPDRKGATRKRTGGNLQRGGTGLPNLQHH